MAPHLRVGQCQGSDSLTRDGGEEKQGFKKAGQGSEVKLDGILEPRTWRISPHPTPQGASWVRSRDWDRGIRTGVRAPKDPAWPYAVGVSGDFWLALNSCVSGQKSEAPGLKEPRGLHPAPGLTGGLQGPGLFKGLGCLEE